VSNDSPRVLQVEIEAVDAAGGYFKNVSTEYAGTMKNGTPFPVPDGGADAFDELTRTVLGVISELHVEAAQSMWDHGAKLSMAAQVYRSADGSVTSALLNVNPLLDDTGKAPIPDDAPTYQD
jgi:Family of unknown function (DUF6317)